MKLPKLLSISSLIGVGLLRAEDAPKPTPTLPEITVEQQADYLQAQVEQLQADARMKAAIESMQKTCNERQVILNDQKRPVCGKK